MFGGGPGSRGGKGASPILASFFCSQSGGVVTLKKSKNVASVTRLAASYYRVTFSSPMPHANYAFAGGGQFPGFGIDNTCCVSFSRDTSVGARRTLHDCDLRVQAQGGTVNTDALYFAGCFFDPEGL